MSMILSNSTIDELVKTYKLRDKSIVENRYLEIYGQVYRKHRHEPKFDIGEQALIQLRTYLKAVYG